MKAWNIWVRLGAVLLMPLVLVLVIETIARLSFVNAARWMLMQEAGNPLRYTYLLLVFAFVSLYAITNRLRWAAICGFCVFAILAILHAGKEILLQQPLVPSDFLFMLMSARVWSNAFFPFTWTQISVFCLLAVAWVLGCRYVLPDVRLDRKRRLISGLFALCLVQVLAAHPGLFASRTVPVYRKLTFVWRPEDNQNDRKAHDPGIQNPDFSAAFNYVGFGLITGFLLNLDNQSLEEDTIPIDYTAAAVRQAWQNLSPEPPGSATATPPSPEDRPHVVIILSESFWDAGWLDGVGINPDPLSCFRRLGTGANACIFNTVSPIFGGYTCNAEFEVLTGISMATLPPGTVPHSGHLKPHTPALPAVFKENGYATVAIHPFLADFWNRNLVYPMIGFDRFVHIGEMRHREVKGKFISDNAVADEIIDVLDAATGPAFVLAVTMQNHSPYGDKRYGDVEADTVWIETPAPGALGVAGASGGDIPDDTAPSPRVNVTAVRDYVHGLRDADAMLDKLTRRFAGSARPVLLLFFGDHQPNLIPMEAQPGEFTQRVRPEAGFPGFDSKRKYQGVALFWVSQGELHARPQTPLSMAALPAWVLREAKLPLPPFFRLSEQVFQRYPVLHGKVAMTFTGEVCAVREPFTDPLLRDYRVISRDLMLGKNYSAAATSKMIGQ